MRLPLLRLAVLCALGAWLLVGVHAVREAPRPLAPTVPAVWVVDFAQKAAPGAQVRGPLQGQKRPPCSPGQVELKGGCWLQVLIPPRDVPPGGGCPTGYFSHSAACYAPVAQGAAVPTSVGP